MSEYKQEVRIIMTENENIILVSNENTTALLSQLQQASFPSKDEVIEGSNLGKNCDDSSVNNYSPIDCNSNIWNSERGEQMENFQRDERETKNYIEDENENSYEVVVTDNGDSQDGKGKRDGAQMENRTLNENGNIHNILGNCLVSTVQNENQKRNESEEMENERNEKDNTFKITAMNEKILITDHDKFVGGAETKDDHLSITNKGLQNSRDSSKRNHEENEDGDISERCLCYVCGKTYSQVSHLSRHIKSAHTKETFLQCTICDATFTRAESLIRHLKLHEQRHGGSATKGPFKCPLCSKAYQQQYNVSRHLLTHYGKKPFQCPVCYKTFTQHTGLSRHLIIHKGSRDFKCDVCGKAFARQFVLSRHKLIHTEDKPYKCFMCSKSFIRGSQLECHMKVHKKKARNEGDKAKSH